MPKDDINYSFRENGVVYDFYDVFVPAENFIQPALWIWGDNTYGESGDGTNVSKSTPVTTFAGGTNWKSIACGNTRTVAIKTDGTLWTWGKNVSGQLGDNTFVARSTPVTTFAGGNNWKSVASGYEHAAAIKTDGTLWTWGVNGDGRLGNNTTTVINTPVTTILGGNDWKSVAGGNYYTIALKTDGTLWTWGRNSEGQLGDNTAISRSTPVTTFLGGNNWKSVAGFGFHTVALKTDGTLWSWGRNNYGQLGDNTTTDRSTPVTTFLGGTNWKSIATGGYHTLAIKTDGTLWSWGANISGQLGINDTTSRNTPVTTIAGGTDWKSISSGYRFSLAIKTDGTLWIWGSGGSGQLGNNTFVTRSTPVTTFLGGNNWKSVAGGLNHTIAIRIQPNP
jgi:alpha-tubulin suppressor-like RCC1 family protein